MSLRFFDDSLLHTDASQTALHLFTAYLFGLWSLKLALEPFPALAHLPQGMVDPVGLLRALPEAWLGTFVTVTGFWILKIVAIACAILSMVPALLTFAGPIACLAITLEQSAIRSFGIVSHPETAPLVAAWVLVLFAWYRKMGVGTVVNSPPNAFNAYSVPLVTIAVILTAAYSFVGINRLVFDGGLFIFFSESLPNYILHRTLAPSLFGFTFGEAALNTSSFFAFLVKVGFLASTLVEITAPLCLVSRYYRYFFFSVMIPFHLVILVTMNISFHENVLLYAVLFDSSGWSS